MLSLCPKTKSAASGSPNMLASAAGLTLPFTWNAPPRTTSSACTCKTHRLSGILTRIKPGNMTVRDPVALVADQHGAACAAMHMPACGPTCTELDSTVVHLQRRDKLAGQA